MASTYVNDLRLNEMATGDQSGSWGTVTNTNLELIAEAFGFGTEAITTNADTHTSTIADGATDPIRALFIKYTGTLDSTCTITIGPNTVNKFCFIHNATSGSQSIIISQGSGANVTITTGQTKAVYLDGAGSGAAVIDAFATLSLGATEHSGNATFADSAKVQLGAGADLQIFYDGSNAFINNTVAGALSIKSDDINLLSSASENMATFVENGAVTLYHDNAAKLATASGGVTVTGTFEPSGKITADAGIDIDNFNIDGTTIALSSGDMTLDGAADIVFDAAGNDFKFSAGGTHVGNIDINGSDFIFKSIVSDKDIIFKGNDLGSEVTALTLDMSDAGTATFNHDVKLGDNSKIVLGAGEDGTIYSDGTTVILTAAASMTFDVGGTINLNADSGSVNLIDASTTYAELVNSSSDFVIKSSQNDKDLIFKGVDGGGLITALTLDMSAAGAATFNNDVTAFSDERLKSDIATIPDALSKVSEMRGVHYVRNETGQASSGVIAQELQKIAPELVRTAEDEMGTLSVNYGNITGYLIEAIKELKAEIEELKAR
jgi:hypothetical protein